MFLSSFSSVFIPGCVKASGPGPGLGPGSGSAPGSVLSLCDL